VRSAALRVGVSKERQDVHRAEPLVVSIDLSEIAFTPAA
jgi:hypothetical protein